MNAASTCVDTNAQAVSHYAFRCFLSPIASESIPTTSRTILMNKTKFNQTMLRHSLLWGWAFLTPPIVMVVLDLFDRHTPTSVALVSTFALMIPFIVATKLISSTLSPLVTDGETE